MLKPKPELRGCRCAKESSQSAGAAFPQKNGLGKGGTGTGGRSAGGLTNSPRQKMSILLNRRPKPFLWAFVM